MINSIVRYFDLQSVARGEGRLQAGSGAKPAVWLQYLVVVAGIIAEPYYHSYASTGGFGAFTLGGFAERVVFAIMTGIIILPSAYKKAFDDENPTFIQLCPLFLAGIGWQSFVSASVDLVSQGAL